jgi:hypothetical protein
VPLAALPSGARHGSDIDGKILATIATKNVPAQIRTKRIARPALVGESDALDLDRGVFIKRDPKRIAASLKRSAERSRRRKADPYRSALSMLTFYINRAGKNLPPGRRKTLERAKGELRKQFHRD